RQVVCRGGNVELSEPIALTILVAVIMVSAAISMIASTKENESHDKNPEAVARMYMLLRGAAVGVVSGLVGAGGGFLIIPALVVTVGLPMKRAVGTSLFIVATQSILGFMGDLHHREFFDWQLLVLFTTCAVFGIFIGISLSKKIAGAKLKSGFGWFVLVMGLYILVKELM